jgi:hypothetical protein
MDKRISTFREHLVISKLRDLIIPIIVIRFRMMMLVPPPHHTPFTLVTNDVSSSNEKQQRVLPSSGTDFTVYPD